MKEKWLRSLILDSKVILFEALLSSFFVNLLALAIPVFVLQVYDRVVFNAGYTTLQGLVIGMVLVILFDGILRYGRVRLFQSFGIQLDGLIGRALITKILNLPLRILETRNTESWHQLFKDLDLIRNSLSGASAALIFDLPFAVLFLGVVYFIAPSLGIVFLVIVPMFVLLAWISGAMHRKMVTKEREAQINRDQLLSNILQARTTVKSLDMASSLRGKWEALHASAITQSSNRGRVGDAHQVLAGLMALVSTVAITSVGALLILQQELTIGSLIASNMLAGRLVAPISSLVAQWKGFAQMRLAKARLDELFALEEDRVDASIELPEPRGKFKFENLSFRYSEGGRPVINGISGSIGPKGLYCIMGKNGSGKSTLSKLLAGLYQPEDGRILLDEGDMKQFTRSQLSKWIGVLPQDTALISGSVKQNITASNQDYTDAQIIEAAEFSGIHEVIIDHADGYDAEVGENGSFMSGGERQRLCLARAVIGRPPILLLDEPTSHLDSEVETLVAKRLYDYARDRTVICVTHSPAILNNSDFVLLLDKGRVAVAGPSSKVLEELRKKKEVSNSETVEAEL
ncbi:peptidase domain-containing ABC transporter [Curvivirga aplysinae]|uniref:peptidase domain-containing ABC transporter n=1 Tax=Curvivirga aplysinae TaxID=2529852 RepID=UPI0012BBFA25|nr:peptidase domain-containing ABC transporter [Curvivirga aplysinae]MTI09561.1 peptidase domain-containing ABC transporter [Curvivirga aplysinae]